MKNYKEIWKSLNNKMNTLDVVNYCIVKALAAKTEDKFELIKIFLSKAFTPIRNPNKLANGSNPYQSLKTALWSLKCSVGWKTGEKHIIFGVPAQDFFDTPEEFEKYRELILALYDYDLNKLDRHYCYIFMDTETVSPEQAMVQASHATMVVGKDLEKYHNPHEIYFQIVHRPPNVTAKDLEKFHNKFKFHHFVEPDLGNKIIASAINPVPWYSREELKNYPLVTFK